MRSADLALVYPMFALVLVTATVMVMLFRRRVLAVQEGLITTSYFRIYQDQGVPEPEDAAKAARHFSNLFEAPTLFYVACLAAMIVRQSGPLMLALAWAYVAARIAHAMIHLGSNRLRWRIRVYFVSWVILMAMWVDLIGSVAIGTHAAA
jgi:hypothetical protein